MNNYVLTAFAALLPTFLSAQQPGPKKAVRFPLPCDRSLPATNTSLVLEFPPLATLEKEGKGFFPYQFIKEGFLKASLQLWNILSSGSEDYVQRNTKLVQELQGLDLGFSLSLLSFPKMRGGSLDFDPRGALLLGQARDSSWVKGAGKRILRVFAKEGETELIEKALGGTPLMGTFLHRSFSEDSNRLGVLAFAHRGKRIAVYSNSFSASDEDTFVARSKLVLENAESALGAGIGTLGLKRGGARVEGIKVFQPKGTILGRLVAHLGPYFQQAEKNWKERGYGEDGPFVLGFHSIQDLQDTLWTQKGKTFEKIEVIEREAVPSIFEVFAPLAPTKARPSDLLPPKALGFLRVSINLPWIKKLFDRFQASKRLALSPSETIMSLNMIRGILGMPIPKENPGNMEDMLGSKELLVLLALPSPGSFWPEIFVLSPKGGSPLSQEDRLLAFAQPALSSIRKKKTLSIKKLIHESIKYLGKGKNRIAYLNIFKVARLADPGRSMSIPEGLFPGGGKLSLGSNERFEILSFSPASLRNYLQGRRSPAQAWNPSELSQTKGEMLQTGFNLAPLVKIYPFKALFLLFSAFVSPMGPTRSIKFPDFNRIGRFLGPENFRIHRLPSRGGKRGMLIINHQGGSMFSPFTPLTLGIGGKFLYALHFGF